MVAAFMAEGLRGLLAGLGPRDTIAAYVDDIGATTFAERRFLRDKGTALGRGMAEAIYDMVLAVNPGRRA